MYYNMQHMVSQARYARPSGRMHHVYGLFVLTSLMRIMYYDMQHMGSQARLTAFLFTCRQPTTSLFACRVPTASLFTCKELRGSVLTCRELTASLFACRGKPRNVAVKCLSGSGAREGEMRVCFCYCRTQNK